MPPAFTCPSLQNGDLDTLWELLFPFPGCFLRVYTLRVPLCAVADSGCCGNRKHGLCMSVEWNTKKSERWGVGIRQWGQNGQNQACPEDISELAASSPSEHVPWQFSQADIFCIVVPLFLFCCPLPASCSSSRLLGEGREEPGGSGVRYGEGQGPTSHAG